MAGFSRPDRSRSLTSDLTDAGSVGWKCRMRPAGMMRPLDLFHEGLLGLFDSSCFANFSNVFAAGFCIACSIRFLEVDACSPKPISRSMF